MAARHRVNKGGGISTIRLVKANPSDPAYHTGLFCPILHFTSLGSGDRSRHVRCDCAELWIRHQTARPKHLTQPTDNAHCWVAITRSTSFTILHRFGQIFGSNEIRPSSPRFISSAFLQHCNLHRLAQPFGIATTPRTIWSACRGSTASNAITAITHLGIFLMSATASARG